MVTMERIIEGEEGVRFVWEEDEDGNPDSGIRIVRDGKGKDGKGKKAETAFPKLDEPLLTEVRVNEEAERQAGLKLEAARKAAAEAAKSERPDVMVFGSKLLDDATDKRDQHVLLTDEKGHALKHKVLDETGRAVTEKEAELADYFPELAKMKIHIRHQIDGAFTGVRLDKVDKENVLWVPATLTHDQVPALIPEIIREVLEAKLRPQRDKVEKARQAVIAKVKVLHREHNTDYRANELRKVEHKLVEAEEAYEHKLEEEVNVVLARVMEEQHLDLAALEGGAEAWIKKLDARSHASVTPNLTEVAKGSLVFGNRHPRYEGVSGWVREKIDKTIIEPILVDQKMIDGIYDQADDQAKNLLPGFVNNIKKGHLGQTWRDAMRLARKGWQGPKHAALKPVGYGLAVGAGLGLALWDLTELPGFKGAKEELQKWGKLALGLLGIEIGGKKGGGGEHH